MCKDGGGNCQSVNSKMPKMTKEERYGYKEPTIQRVWTKVVWTKEMFAQEELRAILMQEDPTRIARRIKPCHLRWFLGIDGCGPSDEKLHEIFCCTQTGE